MYILFHVTRSRERERARNIIVIMLRVYIDRFCNNIFDQLKTAK